jgi:hypothetical protein
MEQSSPKHCLKKQDVYVDVDGMMLAILCELLVIFLYRELCAMIEMMHVALSL